MFQEDAIFDRFDGQERIVVNMDIFLEIDFLVMAVVRLGRCCCCCSFGSLYSKRADNEREVDVSCLAPRGETTIRDAKQQHRNDGGESSNRCDYQIIVVVFVGFIIIKVLQICINLRSGPERVGCGCHSDDRDNEGGES